MLFVKDHDGERWGLPYLDSTRAVGVARLAAIVRQVGSRDGLTVGEAVEYVLDRLAINSVAPEFLFDGDVQRPIPIEGDGARVPPPVWRPFYCSGRDWVAQSKASQHVARKAIAIGAPWAPDPDAWAFMPEVEAVARGLLVRGSPLIGTRHPYGVGPAGLYLMRNEWESLPELPELAGASGACAWLRIHWGQARRFDDLDERLEARLAIRNDVAVRLFGAVPAAENGADACHAIARGYGVGGSVGSEIDAMPKRRGRTIDDKRRAMKRLKELQSQRVAGARKLVADEFGVAERTIGKWIDEVSGAQWSEVLPFSSPRTA